MFHCICSRSYHHYVCTCTYKIHMMFDLSSWRHLHHTGGRYTGRQDTRPLHSGTQTGSTSGTADACIGPAVHRTSLKNHLDWSRNTLLPKQPQIKLNMQTQTFTWSRYTSTIDGLKARLIDYRIWCLTFCFHNIHEQQADWRHGIRLQCTDKCEY